MKLILLVIAALTPEERAELRRQVQQQSGRPVKP
jgi:hypothetical protein